MRQANMLLRASATLVASTTLLTACGGSGGSGGTEQSIDFPFPGSHYLATDATPLSATTTSGLPVTFSSNTPAICTVSDGMLVPVSAGECSVTATQEGNSDFNAAAPAQQLFKIVQHPQAITFPSPGFQVIDSAPAALAATSDSGLAVSFASTTPDVCTVSGSTLTLVSRGQCSIAASQAGDATYAAATPVVVNFLVGDAPPPVITFASGFQSTGQTIEGGGVSTFSGSNKDGWWCSDATWCFSSISSDGSSFTYTFLLQPTDPNYHNTDQGIGAYFGLQLFAPGVTGFKSDGDTTDGIRIDKQASLKFTLAEDAVWYGTKSGGSNNGHNADVKVSLVLGHFALKDSKACNIAVQAIFTPTSASAQTYQLELDQFTAVSESCNVSGLNAANELASYPIVQIKLEAATANVTASVPTPRDPTYPTAITLTGPITFQ
jgi:hypothetical protein